MNKPLITAHSGCLGTAPNSQAHVEAAVAAGADFVEVDVRLSGGRLVLSHDPAGPGVLTLDAVWDFVAGSGLGFNLDVKEEAVLPVLARFLETRNSLKPGSVIVTGCDAAWASQWRSIAPGVPVLLNVLVGPVVGETSEAWETRITHEARQCGAAGLNADYRLVTPGLLALTRRAVLPMYVWTVNETDALKQWLASGVEGVTTDRLDVAHALLTRT